MVRQRDRTSKEGDGYVKAFSDKSENAFMFSPCRARSTLGRRLNGG